MSLLKGPRNKNNLSYKSLDYSYKASKWGLLRWNFIHKIMRNSVDAKNFIPNWCGKSLVVGDTWC